MTLSKKKNKRKVVQGIEEKKSLTINTIWGTKEQPANKTAIGSLAGWGKKCRLTWLNSPVLLFGILFWRAQLRIPTGVPTFPHFPRCLSEVYLCRAGPLSFAWHLDNWVVPANSRAHSPRQVGGGHQGHGARNNNFWFVTRFAPFPGRAICQAKCGPNFRCGTVTVICSVF